MSSCSAAYRSSHRCLWLVLFVLWTAGTATATRAETSTPLKDTGSGVVIGPHEVLTNAHVVKSCTSVTVFGRSAYLAENDEQNDLAVVHTSDEWPSVASLGNEPVRPGDEVVALGYPLWGELADSANVSVGNVSALAGLYNDSRFLQISAPVQPGNSGGPLFDTNGTLVGIVNSRINDLMVLKKHGSIPQNVNFAIKSEVVRTFLESHGVGYKTAGKLDKKLSAADVGGLARPFTVRVECYGPQDEARPPLVQQQPLQPPVQQVKALPACNSPGVTNVLIRIGLNLGAVVFRVQGGQVSSTVNMRFCRGLAWTSAGKRIITYTVYWDNPATGQYRVNLTWYSGPIW